jgi:hypothetical protein
MNDRPIIGAKVITADGKPLGKLMEIEGDCYKVDAPLQPDYWLNSKLVAKTSPSEIRLSLLLKDLNVVVDHSHGHSGLHSHSELKE